MKNVVYLDNNATTKLRPEVVQRVSAVLADTYGNPSSSYGLGRRARHYIEKSRERMCKHLGIKEHLIFTGSATESNNMVIRGRVARFCGKSFIPHVVTTSIEHSSVYETIQDLTRTKQCSSTFVPVDKNGFLDIKRLDKALKKKHTVLLAVIVGNNEIGTLQDMSTIHQLCSRYPTVHLHADVTQVVGKYHVDLSNYGWDSASFSAHKFNGPKGVGGLYLRDPGSIGCVVTGGSQENNIRAGTENTAYIVGMETALRLALHNLSTKQSVIKKHRDWLEGKIRKELPGTTINASLADPSQRLYNTLSISFPARDSRKMLKMLDKHGVFVNVGSACNKGERSRVLEAIGLSEELEKGTLRISLSYDTSRADCRRAFDVIKKVIVSNSCAL